MHERSQCASSQRVREDAMPRATILLGLPSHAFHRTYSIWDMAALLMHLDFIHDFAATEDIRLECPYNFYHSETSASLMGSQKYYSGLCHQDAMQRASQDALP